MNDEEGEERERERVNESFESVKDRPKLKSWEQGRKQRGDQSVKLKLGMDGDAMMLAWNQSRWPSTIMPGRTNAIMLPIWHQVRRVAVWD